MKSPFGFRLIFNPISWCNHTPVLSTLLSRCLDIHFGHKRHNRSAYSKKTDNILGNIFLKIQPLRKHTIHFALEVGNERIMFKISLGCMSLSILEKREKFISMLPPQHSNFKPSLSYTRLCLKQPKPLKIEGKGMIDIQNIHKKEKKKAKQLSLTINHLKIC